MSCFRHHSLKSSFSPQMSSPSCTLEAILWITREETAYSLWTSRSAFFIWYFLSYCYLNPPLSCHRNSVEETFLSWIQVCFQISLFCSDSLLSSALAQCPACIYFLLFMYLAALGLSCSRWQLLFWHTGSLVVARGLSSPMACWLLVPWPGIEPERPALQGGFLTTGPPGECPALG